MNQSVLGLYYEDFVEGEEIKHALSKTVFESDNNFFSLMTMNHHPVHTNVDYASHNQHGQLLVVGTLVFSLVVGMTVPDISGKAIANLGYESIKHLAPTFIGDTLYARTRIISKRESQSIDVGVGRRIAAQHGTALLAAGLQTLVGYNQRGEDVISFRRNVLVKKKGY